MRASADRFEAATNPGGSGQLPITSPAHETCCAASASNVNLVWLRVPRSAVTTTKAAAATSTATSRSVTPGSASSTSSPPAPSTRVNRPGRSRSAISRTI
ncbi:Uncharacterised protein [Mycobacterium tuberculosis]|nr:Uncharacterised protein [Mycobacterium tuberculosis]